MSAVRSSLHRTPGNGAATGWVQALRGAVVLIVLCGGVYPAVTVLVGGALFPHQAAGSLIESDGRLIGSALVGQAFQAPGYFHGRPSAVAYDAFSSAGSNQAPTNPALRERAASDSQRVSAANGVPAGAIPVDLIAASGSGIDPHISPAAARIQVGRVAAARNLSVDAVAALVERNIEPPVLGVLGQPRVNVLVLNLALDALAFELAYMDTADVSGSCSNETCSPGFAAKVTIVF